MLHLTVARASLGKRLLTTTSALAIAAGISAAAHAQQITNPNPIPNPTVATGQTVTAIVFNDGATHTGSIVNDGTLTPLAGFAYTHLHTDGSVESGAGAADLDFNGTDTDSLTSSVGARASLRIDTEKNGVFVPEAHGIWQHEYLDDRAKVGVAFTESPGGRFTIVSSRFGADTGLLGVGVS